MIGKLKGIIREIHDSEALLETPSGVFYRVYVSPSLASVPSDGESIELYTHLQVREDDLTLFGFETYEIYRLFTYCIAVDGVGPKIGFLIVCSSTSDGIRQAVSANDVAFFQKIKGVGKKTAQRLLIELSSRFGSEFDVTSGQETQDDTDALDALVSLGFTRKDARKALLDIDASLPLDKRITQALQSISRR